VVDRNGHVIGVTRAKEAGIGVEGLSFAIPIAVVCSTLSIC
jgi:S1-C subfamily serine protease